MENSVIGEFPIAWIIVIIDTQLRHYDNGERGFECIWNWSLIKSWVDIKGKEILKYTYRKQ